MKNMENFKNLEKDLLQFASTCRDGVKRSKDVEAVSYLIGQMTGFVIAANRLKRLIEEEEEGREDAS